MTEGVGGQSKLHDDRGWRRKRLLLVRCAQQKRGLRLQQWRRGGGKRKRRGGEAVNVRRKSVLRAGGCGEDKNGPHGRLWQERRARAARVGRGDQGRVRGGGRGVPSNPSGLPLRWHFRRAGLGAWPGAASRRASRCSNPIPSAPTPQSANLRFCCNRRAPQANGPCPVDCLADRP